MAPRLRLNERNWGDRTLLLPSLGVPWAAPHFPGLDPSWNRFPRLGGVSSPRPPTQGFDFSRRKTGSSPTRLEPQAAQSPRAALKPLGLILLFGLLNKPFLLIFFHTMLTPSTHPNLLEERAENFEL